MKFTPPIQFGQRRRLPMILQAEAAECGLACLAMIATYHGLEIDIAALRREFSVSMRGITLARLIEVADGLGLQSRALRLDLDELSELKTPCILHWNLSHFVVLKKYDGRRASLHDPSSGERQVSIQELSKSFTGIALELVPGSHFEPRNRLQTISWSALTGRMKGLRSALSAIFILAMVLELVALISPLFMQIVLDQVLTERDDELLFLLCIGFLILLIGETAINALRLRIVARMALRLNLGWSGNVFSHLMKLPDDYFQKRHLGEVASRFGSLSEIQRSATTSLVEALLDGIMATLTLALMLVYSLTLSAITVFTVVLYCAARTWAYPYFRRGAATQINASARQQSLFFESIRGAQAIRLFNGSARSTSAYRNLATRTANCAWRIQGLSVGFDALNRLIFGAERIVVIGMGAALALQGQFSAGMLIAFSAYSSQFALRSAKLVDYVMQLRMLSLHGERLADIVMTPPEAYLQSPYLGPPPRPHLSIKDLSFRYADGEPWILHRCNLEIAAGESVALIGNSGCGKTTLGKIILGMLDAQEGQMEIGGIDIRRLGKGRYRELIAAVMQDDFLFAGTLADNIAFFEPEARLADIEHAARLACVHDDIVKMPMGYHTLVGDMGSVLSGGQKQRVLLARALYRKPSILLLDEATSHLDLEAERAISQAVRRLQITRILIAHRPETIASADRVLRVADGQISEDPQELPMRAEPFVRRS